MDLKNSGGWWGMAIDHTYLEKRMEAFRKRQEKWQKRIDDEADPEKKEFLRMLRKIELNSCY